MQLRPYQKDCLNQNWLLWRRGGRRLLNALPTGTGKTVIFSQLPRAFKGRYLVIAHRKELLDQAAGKLQETNPGLSVAVEQAERQAPDSADVVVASIQTLAVSPKRLDRLAPGSFGTVVVDEAHHIMAQTYCTVLARMGLAPDLKELASGQNRKAMRLFKDHQIQSESPLLLGFTATPHRTDRLGLEYIFDEMAYSRTIPEMMAEGWLCRIIGWRVATVDLSGVRMSNTDYGRDYRESDLSAIVDTPERNRQAVAAYREHCNEQPFIAFCVDVAHTHHLADAFANAGVKVAAITGATPKGERDSAIAAYRRGDLDGLVNCMVLTEGFDAPETSCLLMCRPTQSQLLYTQMLGRGTRPAVGKEKLTVLDTVDVTSTGVCTLNTLFGLPPSYDLDGEDVQEAAEAQEQAAIREKQERRSRGIREPGEIDPLAIHGAKAPGAKFQWVQTQYGWAVGLPERQYLGVVVDLLGHAVVKAQLSQQQPTVLSKHFSERDAIKSAEEWLGEQFRGIWALKNPNAAWRHQAPSEKQLEACLKLRIPIPEGATKGEVSNLMDSYFAERIGKVFA